MILPSIVETGLVEDEEIQGKQDVAAANRKHEHVTPLLKKDEHVSSKELVTWSFDSL